MLNVGEQARAAVTLAGMAAGHAAPRISNTTSWLSEGCHAPRTGRELYEAQKFFTIYVHRSPGVAGSPPDSIFHGRDIPDRCSSSLYPMCLTDRLHCNTCMHNCSDPAASTALCRSRLYAALHSWHHERSRLWRACRIQGGFAQPSLVAAHRKLLRAALEEPSNTMFVLLSESCVPLYHPALFWTQLMTEAHLSRVDVGRYSEHRWNSIMETEVRSCAAVPCPRVYFVAHSSQYESRYCACCQLVTKVNLLLPYKWCDGSLGCRSCTRSTSERAASGAR